MTGNWYPILRYADMTDEYLTVLSPHGDLPMGKTFTVRDDGRIVAEQKHHVWFKPSKACFDTNDIHSLARLIRGVEDGDFPPCILVRGEPLKAGSITRRKSFGKGKNGKALPVGIRDKLSRHVLIDADNLPNPEDLDPRHDMASVVEWFRTLLPSAMYGVGMVVYASSSSCLKNLEGKQLGEEEIPSTLRFHAHIVLSEGALEAEVRKLLKAIDGHIRSVLVDRYGVLLHRAIDPATATCNQPIYIGARYTNGVKNPFEGRSRVMVVEGSHLDVDDVMSSCMVAPSYDVTKPSKKNTHKPRKNIPDIEKCRHKLAVDADRTMAAAKTVDSPKSYKEWCRAAMEAIEIIIDMRRECGMWPNGMPEGTGRSSVLMKVAALSRRAGWRLDKCQSHVMKVAEFYMDGGRAYGQEWIEKSPGAFSGVSRPGADGIIEDLNITPDELSVLSTEYWNEALTPKKVKDARRRLKMVRNGKTVHGKDRKRPEKDKATIEAEKLGISRAKYFRLKKSNKLDFAGIEP